MVKERKSKRKHLRNNQELSLITNYNAGNTLTKKVDIEVFQCMDKDMNLNFYKSIVRLLQQCGNRGFH